MRYTVNVGNIGNIECGTLAEAKKVFAEYCIQSKNNHGRATGEDVFIIDRTGEIIAEYYGEGEGVENDNI